MDDAATTTRTPAIPPAKRISVTIEVPRLPASPVPSAERIAQDERDAEAFRRLVESVAARRAAKTKRT